VTNQHDRTTPGRKAPSQSFHPRFARFYEWYARLGSERRLTDPLRQETAGQAFGIVLEVGAGSGLNFSWYQPERVERVEAVEPDAAMLAYARSRASQAAVPITLTQASVEALPFSDATFDSAVVTLVFCSVRDPAQGMQEIKRVLKPDGTLFMFEHVRSQRRVMAYVQDAIVPLTTRLFGHCHWNRDTERVVREAGFQIDHLRHVGGGSLDLSPHFVLQAHRS
jgi:ubiquinone/menaquinone biosynthesis C-methylase UbiE